MKATILKCLAAVWLIAVLAQHSQADTFGSGANAFTINFTAIGDPGNPAFADGGTNPYGKVDYEYRISTYEVSRQMITNANALGGLGVALKAWSADYEGPDKAAAGMTWNQAARFVNFLNTNSGYAPAYKFGLQPGATNYDSNANISLWEAGDPGYNPANPYRNTNAFYFLPSVDEWFKAAYYNKGGASTGGPWGSYWPYPTASTNAPERVTNGTNANTAVYGSIAPGPADIDQAGGSNSYGTMGQGGNVYEWTETLWGGSPNTNADGSRIIYGGNSQTMGIGPRDSKNYFAVATGYELLGFRVASMSISLGTNYVFTNAVVADQGAANISGGNAANAFAIITNQGGVTTVIISNSAPLAFTNANNSYSGTTVIEQGTLVAMVNAPNAANGAFGNASSAIEVGSTNAANTNAATLLIGAAGVEVGRAITINAGGTGMRTVGATNATGTATYSGNILMNTNVTLSASNAGATTLFSGALSGAGSLVKDGAGTVTLAGSNTCTGDTTVQGGTLKVTGSVSETIVVYVDNASALVISDGGRVANTAGLIGYYTDSSGNTVLVTGTNSVWTNSGWLYAGYGGSTNSLAISNGGRAMNTYGVIGYDSSSSGNTVLLTGPDSVWTNSNELYVGYSGSSNTLAISNGGRAMNTYGYIGAYATSSNNSVLVTGTGSQWTNSQALFLGYIGGGNSLTIANGGTVAATNVFIASLAGSGGTLNIGALGGSDSAGTLSTSAITFGSGTGVINFNQTNAFTLAANITGGGSLKQLGSGTTTLTGSNSYTGTTTISAGTLQIGNGGAGGTLGIGNVTNDAMLTINRSDAITISNQISGWGHLTQLGAGTTTLAGSSTYVGNTTVQGGTLRIPGTVSGTTNVSVENGSSLVVSNNGRLEDGYGWIGTNSSGNSVLIVGGNSVWSNSLSLHVGYDGSSNTLTISNGGRVIATTTTFIGWSGSSKSNAALVTGANSVWSNGALYVGYSGSGNALEISDGGNVASSTGSVGNDANASNNTVLVTGTSSAWTNSGRLVVGNYGSGNSLTISNGGNVTANTNYIGQRAGSSNNTVLVSGTNSVLTIGKDLSVGWFGNGSTLTVSNGGRATSSAGYVGYDTNSSNNSVLVTGAGSAWTNTNSIFVGHSGSGNSLTISDGGRTESTNSYIGRYASAIGNTVLVTGSNSAWANLGSLYVGFYASGNNMTISNGGQVTSRYSTIGSETNASNNTVVVTGAASLWTNSGTLYVGSYGGGNSLTISDGGRVASADGYVGAGGGLPVPSSSNTVTVTGANSIWTNSSTLYVGYGGSGNSLTISNGGRVANADGYVGSETNASNNTVLVSGANSVWTNNGHLYIGLAGGGNTLTIANGARVANTFGHIGFTNNSSYNSVFVTGSNSVWANSASLYIGFTNGSSANSLVISNGGCTASLAGYVGRGTDSSNNTVLVTGAGSLWTNTGSLSVGYDGSGNSLTISNGAQAAGQHGVIGGGAGSSNNTVVVTGNSSVWTNSETLSVGTTGSGNALTISAGGRAANANGYIGRYAGSSNNTVLVTGTGSVWTNSDSLYVGPNAGGSTLLIANGGSVAAASNVVIGAGGTVNIGALGGNDATGTLSTPVITFSVSGAGALNFNQTNTFALAANISGSGSLKQLGSGTTTLTGTNSTYTGNLVVSNGTVAVNGAMRGATVSVGNASLANGPVLMGTGSVGAVSINSNGMISPGNSVGTLSVSNALSWNAGGSYRWEITNAAPGAPGTNWDLITVDTGTVGAGQGTLAIGGAFTVNGAQIGGFVFDDTQNYTGNYFQIVKAANITGSLTNLSFAGFGTGSWTFSTNATGLYLNYVGGSLTNLVFTNAVVADQGAANISGGNAAGDFATITNMGGTTVVIISNSAPLAFTNANNSYTGATVIEQGTLVAMVNAPNAANGAFGRASSAIQIGSTNAANTNAATLLIGAAGVGVGRAIVINAGGTGTRTVGATNATGTATYSGNILMNTNVTLTAANAGGTTLFSGALSGVGSLVKDGAGTVTLTGANTYSGGTLVSDGTLQGNTTSLQGNITNNASLVFNQSANGTYASTISGTGALTKSGSGTVTLAGTNTYAGNTLVQGGTLQVANTGSVSGTAQVRVDNASGLVVSGGGRVAGSIGYIGYDTDSSGNTVLVTGAGSLWTNSSDVSAGTYGSGNHLVISNGGAVHDVWGIVGNATNSSNNTALVTGAGSLWTNSERLYAGGNGSGNSLVISNGARAASESGYVGAGEKSSNNTALVTGTNSLWTNSFVFYVGDSGSGNSLTISNGGQLASQSGAIGSSVNSSGNTVLVTGAGSLWTNRISLRIGNYGSNNTLTIANAGTVAAAYVIIGQDGGSGTINIGRFGGSDSAGTLNTPSIMFALRGGVINFNQTNAFALGAEILGNGSVFQRGSGVTTLGGASTYTGGTTVNAGRLVTTSTNALGTGNVTVNGGVLAPAVGSALQVGGNLSIGAAGGYGWQLLANSATGAGTNFTAPVNLAGNLSIATNAAFEIYFGGTVSSGDAFWVPGGTNSWTVIESTSSLASGLNFRPVWAAGSTTNGFNLSGFSFTTNSGALVLNYFTPLVTDLIARASLTTVSNTASYPNVIYEPSGRLLVTPGGNLTITNPVIMSNNSTTTVNGTFTSPGGFQILYGSTLTGSGILNGDLVNGGLLSPDASPGTMTINGNYTQTSTGMLNVPGRFVVTQTLYLDGGSVLVSGTMTAGNASITGGTLNVPGRFDITQTLLIGGGSLSVSGTMTAGSANITGGTLNVPGRFDITQTLLIGGGSLSVSGTMTAGSANITGGTLNVPGSFDISQTLLIGGGSLSVPGTMTAGSANITGGTLNVGGSFDISQTLLIGGGSLSVPGTMTAGSANITGGTLNLGGSFTVAQSVQLGGGTIIVNGCLTAPTLNIFGSSLLGGSGLIAGNVINSGVVSPGNSPGTMTINGSYTQTTAGTLAMEVGAGAYDRLVVNGAASLGGTLSVSTVDGGTLAFGDTCQFLTASGGITGAFDTISMPSGYRGRFLLGSASTTGTLLVAPQSYTQVAVTPNEARAAGALDAFIPAASGDRFTVSVALDELTTSQYPAAFEQIMPSIYASIPTLAFNQANALNTSMFQRMWMQRISGAGFSSSGMAMEPMQTHLQTAAADKKTVLPVEPARKDWGVFADGNGIFATANSGGALQDYRSQSGGVTAGASYKWNDNFATGVYAGYQGLVAQYDGGSRLTDNAVRFGGFGTVGVGGAYFNGLVGGAYHGYDVSRNIEFGTVNRTARGKPGAGEFDLALATGYDFKAGRFTFGPSTSMQYTYLGVQGFNETGADSLNLDVQGYNSSSLLYSLGAQVAYRWEIMKHFAVTPMLSANWQHEFMQNAYPINAAFNTGGPSSSFYFETSRPQQDYFYAGAGLGFDFGDTWKASFFYNAAAGNQDLVSHNIYLSIGAKF